MGATIEQERGGIWVVRIFGALRKKELDDVQAAALAKLESRNDAKVLVLVDESFLGWVGDEVWNDMTFFVQHGDQIEKFAIVGDPKWESRMLMFTGAGMRRSLVKYFTPDRLAEAHAWLG